jgi:hypothetical protein
MKSKSCGIIFLALLLLPLPGLVFTQETDAEGITEKNIPEGDSDLINMPDELKAEAQKKSKTELPPELKNIEMEIDTSTLVELAAWCRSLGLSEGGDVKTLKNRLRTHFKLPQPSGEATDAKKKIITIDSARSTEYFKIEAVDEEYARLTGDVKVSLKDGDAVHTISAWDILFNRTRNIITASGGVEYVKEEGAKKETFKGESITVNIDNWSSVFLGGVSEHSQQGENKTAYLFSGTVISRNDEDVTVLSKASISSASNEEALWSLNASRVWLLPGSDFAMLNAVLKVGEIPVLYIPFFYFPADEVVFHPVLGSRTREGSFVQTTTYILGKREASKTTESSLTTIMGNSDNMEKKWEGLFLRSTGKPDPKKNDVKLKLIVDYYANLGWYWGTDLTLPKFGILNPINFSAAFGYSRILVPVGSSYSPFAPNYDGSDDWDPRYRLNFSSSISGKYGNFSWTIPFYSDPWVDRDFLNRAEDMDWVNMIQKGAALDEDVTAETQMGAYVMQFTGNLNPKFPNMQPFISSVSINTISSAISFKNKQKVFDSTVPSNDRSRFSPLRDFFVQDAATLSVGGAVSGTPINLGQGKPASASGSQQKQELPNHLEGIGAPRSPWESEISETEQKTGTTETLSPPVLAQRFEARPKGNMRFSFDYNLRPTATTQWKWDSNQREKFEDIKVDNIASTLTNVRGDGRLGINFSHSTGLFSSSLSWSGYGLLQYIDLNENAKEFETAAGVKDDAKIKKAKEDQYRNRNFNTSYAFNFSVKPLYWSSIFAASSLQYDRGGLAVKKEFKEMKGDKPEWKDLEWGSWWEKEKTDRHQLSANLSASVMEKAQSLNVGMDLPPRDSSLRTAATINAWISTTSTNMLIRFPEDEEKRKLEPLYASETLKFWDFGTLSLSMVWDWGDKKLNPERKEGVTSFTANLNMTALWLTIAYSGTRSRGYELDSSRGWVVSTGKESHEPKDLSFAFNPKALTQSLWNDRLSYSLNFNTGLFFDLQRYTSSRFNMGLTFTLKIPNFLDLSMSVNSENAVIYRYYRSLIKDLPAGIRDAEGEQYNLFLDLLNSFRFDDDNRRRSSGFKMKSFSMNLTRKFGDWDAAFGIAMAPYLPAGELKYELNSEVSFSVKWIPISEFKTDMTYSKRDDKWTMK